MWRYEFKDDGFIYLGARSTSLLAEADFWTVEEADAYRAVSRCLFSRLLDSIWRGTLEPGFGRFTDKASGVSIRYLVLQDAVEVKVIVYGVDFDGDDDPGGGPKGPDLDDQIVDWSVVVRRSDGYWVAESVEGCPGFVQDGTRNALVGEQHDFDLRSIDAVHGFHLIADCDGGFCLVFDVDKLSDDFNSRNCTTVERSVLDRKSEYVRSKVRHILLVAGDGASMAYENECDLSETSIPEGFFVSRRVADSGRAFNDGSADPGLDCRDEDCCSGGGDEVSADLCSASAYGKEGFCGSISTLHLLHRSGAHLSGDLRQQIVTAFRLCDVRLLPDVQNAHIVAFEPFARRALPWRQMSQSRSHPTSMEGD